MLTTSAKRIVAALVLALLAAPLVTEAQEYKAGRVYRLAVVSASTPVEEMTEAKDPGLRVLLSELRRLGYTEGRNLIVQRFSGAGSRERYPDVGRDVVRFGPDVIFANTGRLAQAFRTVTTTIPIVTVTTDPVGLGLATSLARPGGNVTGFSQDAGNEILGKRLELLKEAVPRASRIAYLAPRAVWEGPWGQIMREAGTRAGVAVPGAPLGNPLDEPEYRRAFVAMASDRADALVVSDHGEAIAHRRLIVELAAQAKLPAMYSYRVFAEAGGLMSYGADPAQPLRLVVDYIDRIFKGTNAGDLPFQRPTKFELVINLKTAKALGLTIPPSLLLRADQVIE
jgi:putative ABC transport system substrate-binding protein